MAENLRDSICTDVIDGTRKMQVDDDMQKKVSQLKDVKYYGNLFSWEVRESCLGGSDEPIEFKTLDKLVKSLTKQSKRVTFKNGSELFNIYTFYNKLVVCYERFIAGQLDESMTEMESFARSVELMTYDELDEQYISAYKHILYSTYAYIATSMNPYKFDEIMKDIKLISELSDKEKSAIYVVKALVFLKYPSKSKHISFQEADKARLLQDNNAEYLNIWLKTKGRLNREYNNYAKPDDKEVQIAEDLYKISKTFWHCYQVANVFVKVSKHRERNKHTRNKYFNLSSEAMLKAIDLAANDKILVTKCLTLSINQPKLLLPESIIHKKIEELQNDKNDKVYSFLGMYYFKHEKDYEKAKEFFNLSREVDSQDFYSFYNIIKIECIFKNPDEFSFIEMLMDQFQNFSNTIKRVKILSQILIYCLYYTKDKEKLLYFLQKFMDQPFDNAFKYRHLSTIGPVFHVKNYHPKKYVDDLVHKVKSMIPNCDEFHDTVQRFMRMIEEGKNHRRIYVYWSMGRTQCIIMTSDFRQMNDQKISTCVPTQYEP